MMITAAVVLAGVAGLGVWLWAERVGGSASIPYPGEVGAYELPVQSNRRYTREDIIDMVDDCNEQAAAGGNAAGADGATTDAAPFAVEDAGTPGADGAGAAGTAGTSTSSETTGMRHVGASGARRTSAPSETVGLTGTAASDNDASDGNTHPPTTITLTVPAAVAEPLDSQPFRCMAEALGMPAETQRDLVTQSEAFDSGEGSMPMTWNELGFRGWKAHDGTFHLRITWYDPAAQEG